MSIQIVKLSPKVLKGHEGLGKDEHKAKDYKKEAHFTITSKVLQNICQTFLINGCSRKHFYDAEHAYEQYGIECLKEKNRRSPSEE